MQAKGSEGGLDDEDGADSNKGFSPPFGATVASKLRLHLAYLPQNGRVGGQVTGSLEGGDESESDESPSEEDDGSQLGSDADGDINNPEEKDNLSDHEF